MEKYSLSLVMDYINGEDLGEYDVLELENDIVFMTMVFNVSNDKNMYFYVEDDLKKNFEFLRFLIDKFHDDEEFIIRIGKEYMEDANENEIIEMKILLCKYLKDINSVDFMKFKFDLELFYIRQRIINQAFIDKLKDTYYGGINSMGFEIILEEFCDSDLIKEYFAKNMLDEIFNCSFLEFEQMLHLKFKDKDEFSKIGINNYLINNIYTYDECLAGYISVHISLLDEFNKKISKMLSRWEKYEFDKDKEKIEIIFEEIDKFVNDNIYLVGTELEIFKYILDKFDMYKSFFNSKIKLNYFDLEFEGNLDDINDLNMSNFTLELYGNFNKFIDRISSVCRLGIVPDDYLEEVTKPKVKKGKILKLNVKNSN